MEATKKSRGPEAFAIGPRDFSYAFVSVLFLFLFLGSKDYDKDYDYEEEHASGDACYYPGIESFNR